MRFGELVSLSAGSPSGVVAEVRLQLLDRPGKIHAPPARSAKSS